MQDNLYIEYSEIEVLPPDEGDSQLLVAWDDFRAAWKQKTKAEGRDERARLALALEKAALRMMNNRPVSLEGVRAKLVLALCSGHDAEIFARRYIEGHKLPEVLPLNDPYSSQVFDAVVAVERLMQAEVERH